MIVGAYWIDTHYNHHHILKVNKVSIWLNIFFLMFICLIPFSSGLLANYLYSSTSVIVYSINLILVSSWHLAMLVYSWRKRFIHPYVDTRLYRNMIWRIVFPIIIYLLIIPVSLLRTPWVVYLFLLPLFFQIFFGRSKREMSWGERWRVKDESRVSIAWPRNQCPFRRLAQLSFYFFPLNLPSQTVR